MRARFSPEGALGLQLTVGALMLISATWIFGAIAEDVATADTITVIDLKLANWLHAHASLRLTRVMLAVSALNGVAAVSILTVTLAAFFAWRGHRKWLLALTMIVPVGMLLNSVLKLVFARARPHFEDPLMTLATYSFPSGHVAGSTLFYGTLAAFVIAQTHSAARRVAIVSAAILLTALVALSRLYLGVHYLSDVLGAFAECVAWLALCLTGVYMLDRRRAARRTR